MTVWPRVKPGSQNAQILTVLADKRWHTSAEIYAVVSCSLNSRISELRDKGYCIQHRGDGFGPEFHEYLLVQVPLDESAAPAPALSSSGPTVSSPAASPMRARSAWGAARQLDLFGRAA